MNAVCLPPALRYNETVAAAEIARLGEAMDRGDAIERRARAGRAGRAEPPARLRRSARGPRGAVRGNCGATAGQGKSPSGPARGGARVARGGLVDDANPDHPRRQPPAAAGGRRARVRRGPRRGGRPRAVRARRSRRRSATGSTTRSMPAIDLVSDGEMSKIGYATYIRHRLSGFELGDVPRATPADLDAYPRYMSGSPTGAGAPRYLRPDLPRPDRLRASRAARGRPCALAAARRRTRRPIAGAFMNAPSPGIIALFQPNEYYAAPTSTSEALGEAMRDRVRGDRRRPASAPDRRPRPGDGPPHHVPRQLRRGVRGARRRHVEAINHALRDVPADRVRLHLCWGNYEGPHHLDIGVEKIIDVVLRAKPSTILFEAANPRHEHEWAVWREAAIPEDKILVPGVIDSTTQLHRAPRAGRAALRRFAEIVGRRAVIGGTDCGFGTWAGFGADRSGHLLGEARRARRGRAPRERAGVAADAPLQLSGTTRGSPSAARPMSP